MRSYNKLILWMLVILVVINITACNSVVKYQNSIFHDKSKIVKREIAIHISLRLVMAEG